jgi:hypothetical protein
MTNLRGSECGNELVKLSGGCGRVNDGVVIDEW